MCVPLSLMMSGMNPAASAGEQTAYGLSMQGAAQGLGALSSLASGVIQSRAASADAAAATAEGQARARRIRTAGAAEVSRSRSDSAGTGLSVASGSSLEAERQIVRNVEQDAGVAILTGQSRAASLTNQGREAMLNGTLGALAGIYGAADKWKRAKAVMPVVDTFSKPMEGAY